MAWFTPTRIYRQRSAGIGGTIVAYDAVSGIERWHSSETIYQPSALTIDDGTLYVVDNTHLYALDAQTGATLLSREASTTTHSTATIFESATIADGLLYVVNYAHWAIAYDALDGSNVWETRSCCYSFTTPTVVNGVAYL